MSDAFVAFFVGCVVGAVVGIMFFSFILAASDADKRTAHVLDDARREKERDRFGGRCPYTDKRCITWKCDTCEIEENERKWLEKEEGENDDR